MKKLFATCCIATAAMFIMTEIPVPASPDIHTMTVSAKSHHKKKCKKRKKIHPKKKKVTLRVGQKTKLRLVGAKSRKVRWKSKNKSIVKVSKKGKIYARKAGQTTIIAKYKKKRYRIRVIVKAKSISIPVFIRNTTTYITENNNTTRTIKSSNTNSSSSQTGTGGSSHDQSSTDKDNTSKDSSTDSKNTDKDSSTSESNHDQNSTDKDDTSKDSSTDSKNTDKDSSTSRSSADKDETGEEGGTSGSDNDSGKTSGGDDKDNEGKGSGSDEMIVSQNIQSGESWKIPGQWEIKIDSAERTKDRDDRSTKNPAEVYKVNYTYKNLGYINPVTKENKLKVDFSSAQSIRDSQLGRGYIYPGFYLKEPIEIKTGETCNAQQCIGVDKAGNFKIYLEIADSEGKHHRAIFYVAVN
ncbi:MAG: Ig-like domain-containing protein [Lachnospiraceae bacterium]|nr:Ig-like domain-containing protein [Lachnospiraceae bacterium]